MLNTKTVAAATLGCKVNTYDTQSILETFKNIGYTVVDFTESADVYIVNTCTVTAVSDKKSRQMIRRAAGRGGTVVVTGCFAQHKGAEAAAIEGVNIVAGLNERAEIVNMVEQYTAADGIAEAFIGHNKDIFENMPVSGLSDKTRGFVKIQDGCDNFCSFCIIPHVRGRARSRKISDIADEVNSLTGVKEIVLTGICISSYGKDLNGETLTDAVKAAAGNKNILRIRLSSIDQAAVTAELLAAFRDEEKLCPHVHLSLQSGCDKTLRSMNRNYSTAKYAKAAKALRAARPGISITTDIIAGFPGETEEDFLESLSFVEKIGLASLHVFPFSAREGTAAAKIQKRAASSEVRARAARMIALGKRLEAEYISGNIGKEFPVLFESLDKNGRYAGYTPNYISVSVASEEDLRGEIRIARIKSYDESGNVFGILSNS